MKYKYDLLIGASLTMLWLIYIYIICGIFLMFLSSCATIKPNNSRQAVLVSYERVSDNKALLDLRMKDGSVMYGQKFRGAGVGRWFIGDKYTVHFLNDKVVKITLNQ